MNVPVSVLDLTPVPSGSTGADAVRNSIDLAIAAERWGYSRYWVAEHHNTPGMACPAPELMIGQIASATSRIRVGSGGVMLPNHSPLRVAESFRLLEALYPGRIDLGIGRAPGTDGVTAYALRRSNASGDEFPSQLAELLAFTGGGFPDDHPFRTVSAQPADVDLPPIWILGSSDYGAQVAAAMGVGFAFARHLNPRGAVPAMALYRERFAPSENLDSPKAILALSAICAEATKTADDLASSMALGVIRMRQGRPGRLPSPEEAKAHDYSENEADQVRRYRRAQVLGTPDEVRAELTRLVEETGADEVMIMSMVHDHAARMRSYELISGSLGLAANALAGLGASALDRR